MWELLIAEISLGYNAAMDMEIGEQSQPNIELDRPFSMDQLFAVDVEHLDNDQFRNLEGERNYKQIKAGDYIKRPEEEEALREIKEESIVAICGQARIGKSALVQSIRIGLEREVSGLTFSRHDCGGAKYLKGVKEIAQTTGPVLLAIEEVRLIDRFKKPDQEAVFETIRALKEREDGWVLLNYNLAGSEYGQPKTVLPEGLAELFDAPIIPGHVGDEETKFFLEKSGQFKPEFIDWLVKEGGGHTLLTTQLAFYAVRMAKEGSVQGKTTEEFLRQLQLHTVNLLKNSFSHLIKFTSEETKSALRAFANNEISQEECEEQMLSDQSSFPKLDSKAFWYFLVDYFDRQG